MMRLYGSAAGDVLFDYRVVMFTMDPSSGVPRRSKRVSENGNLGDSDASEVYRSDLIQIIKEEPNLQEDDADLIPMQDRWREEWSHGVQVPVHSTTDPPPSLDEVESPYTEDYVMPAERIVCHPSNRWPENTNFELVAVSPRAYYNTDGIDAQWVQIVNRRRAKKRAQLINITNVHAVINELELQVYRSTLQGRRQLFHMAQAAEEDDENAVCDVCRGPDTDSDDEIVFCDGCNLSVHQSCYGITNLPSDVWLCTHCTLRFGKQTSCVLCPTLGGAMKCTADGTLWAHVACALWIPEVRFLDADRREPIGNLQRVFREKLRMVCSVCEVHQGACIKCTAEGCQNGFHVVCGYRAKLALRIEGDADNNDDVRMTALCRVHTEAESKEAASDGDQQCDADIERYFPLYVDVDKVVQKTNLDEDVVNDIVEFWKCKRQRNAGKSLIHEPVELDLSEDKPSESSLSKKMRQIKAQYKCMEQALQLCRLMKEREKVTKETIENAFNVFGRSTNMPAKFCLC
ncbi:hypothetical protein QR680_008044 [Steinernema hermaphroditum]|uniref:PHD-type domain-containing protein n=1 Tax=Steinernema hermaphroditum TaxID=289476 RepID=A0AA39IHB9_9BILA|nr:hypothetical protein QR680_008044 [Steinernema hermaphroditum]